MNEINRKPAYAVTELASTRQHQKSGLGSYYYFSNYLGNVVILDVIYLLGGGDDGELLVRASAVLKSQGPENWPRGRL